MSETAPLFDIPRLIDASRPAPRANLFWFATGACLVLVAAAATAGTEAGTGEQVVETLSLLFTLGVMAAMSILSVRRTRSLRDENAAVQQAGELVHLHRWQEAARSLRSLLSRPMRANDQRFESLLLLSSVLNRYHLFEDAVAVLDHLLETIGLEGPAQHTVKLARGMALLRNEQLFDADRAIAELRRGDARDTSGGLAMLEIYRDVKTGHPADAIEIFEKRQHLIREQLGRRVGDAFALIARAHDQLDHVEAAQSAFTSATLLTEPRDLARRYPEVAPLLNKYIATPSPVGPSTMEGAA